MLVDKVKLKYQSYYDFIEDLHREIKSEYKATASANKSVVSKSASAKSTGKTNPHQPKEVVSKMTPKQKCEYRRRCAQYQADKRCSRIVNMNDLHAYLTSIKESGSLSKSAFYYMYKNVLTKLRTYYKNVRNLKGQDRSNISLAIKLLKNSAKRNTTCYYQNVAALRKLYTDLNTALSIEPKVPYLNIEKTKPTTHTIIGLNKPIVRQVYKPKPEKEILKDVKITFTMEFKEGITTRSKYYDIINKGEGKLLSYLTSQKEYKNRLKLLKDEWISGKCIKSLEIVPHKATMDRERETDKRSFLGDRMILEYTFTVYVQFQAIEYESPELIKRNQTKLDLEYQEKKLAYQHACERTVFTMREPHIYSLATKDFINQRRRRRIRAQLLMLDAADIRKHSLAETKATIEKMNTLMQQADRLRRLVNSNQVDKNLKLKMEKAKLRRQLKIDQLDAMIAKRQAQINELRESDLNNRITTMRDQVNKLQQRSSQIRSYNFKEQERLNQAIQKRTNIQKETKMILDDAKKEAELRRISEQNLKSQLAMIKNHV